MNGVLDVVAAVLVVGGALLAVLGAAGVARFADPLAAMHAATKPATLGVLLCGAGAILRVDDASAISKIAVVVALQLVTAPIGAHMLSRAIWRAGSNGAAGDDEGDGGDGTDAR